MLGSCMTVVANESSVDSFWLAKVIETQSWKNVTGIDYCGHSMPLGVGFNK